MQTRQVTTTSSSNNSHTVHQQQQMVPLLQQLRQPGSLLLARQCMSFPKVA
jgi:hypothetical protein